MVSVGLEVKDAIRGFQYAEGLRSELMIAHKLLEELRCLKGEELKGGEKIALSFFGALMGEMRFAQNAVRSKSLLDAETKIMEATGSVKLHRFEDAVRSVAEAVSLTSNISCETLTLLQDRKLL